MNRLEVAHQDFVWRMRSDPRITSVFAALWGVRPCFHPPRPAPPALPVASTSLPPPRAVGVPYTDPNSVTTVPEICHEMVVPR